MTPKWISRWVKRWEDKFPECTVVYHYSGELLGYIVEACYPKQQVRGTAGNWKITGILLNPSHSPAVRQNRRHYRDYADYTLRGEIDRFEAER